MSIFSLKTIFLLQILKSHCIQKAKILLPEGDDISDHSKTSPTIISAAFVAR